MSFLTLTERKNAKVATLQAEVVAFSDRLSTYARAHEGRFLLYGSAARGDIRFGIDVDLIVDFSEPAASAAWRFAEQACWELGVEPDIRPLAWCRPGFLERIRPEAVEPT
ncbi:MAG: nucleotidyltransferase domain-containing protein [Pseudomonadota bacterium]|nr:nucleotidyltransferase domain-containing protein [Pseudomonadota bacterium]